MIESKSLWNGVADKQKWAARGASFVAKVKATKLVWFPPTLEETGRTTAATAKRTTENPTDKATGAAEEMTNSGKKATNAVRRKDT